MNIVLSQKKRVVELTNRILRITHESTLEQGYEDVQKLARAFHPARDVDEKQINKALE